MAGGVEIARRCTPGSLVKRLHPCHRTTHAQSTPHTHALHAAPLAVSWMQAAMGKPNVLTTGGFPCLPGLHVRRRNTT